MMKRFKVFVPTVFTILFGAAFFFTSCYPGDPLTSAESDLVVTFFNQNADFSTKLTYSRPDEVFEADTSAPQQPGAYDATIIAQIDENMQALGFTLESDPANADVHLIPLVSTTSWVTGGCYPPYYGGWYGYPYYGWCYPVAYSFETGSIVIIMLDRTGESNTEATLWIAGINGLITGAEAQLPARINSTIDQAFRQSPYLGAGK